jgi:hypothetical protein
MVPATLKICRVAALTRRMLQTITAAVAARTACRRAGGLQAAPVSDQPAADGERREPNEPARRSTQNTAAEPKSLITPISGCCSRVMWSASFSIAVFSSSTASTRRSAPILATY